jgi:hypothetical protein
MFSDRKSKTSEFSIQGWYLPSESHTLENVCVVESCGLPAAYHLCPKHAFPGAIVDSTVIPGKQFVIGFWIVETNGDPYVMVLSDIVLGLYFGDRENFEEHLVSRGYTILNFSGNWQDQRNFEHRYPDVPFIACTPNPDPPLPELITPNACQQREKLARMQRERVRSRLFLNQVN